MVGKQSTVAMETRGRGSLIPHSLSFWLSLCPNRFCLDASIIFATEFVLHNVDKQREQDGEKKNGSEPKKKKKKNCIASTTVFRRIQCIHFGCGLEKLLAESMFMRWRKFKRHQYHTYSHSFSLSRSLFSLCCRRQYHRRSNN